jgi:hypothetical protein
LINWIEEIDAPGASTKARAWGGFGDAFKPEGEGMRDGSPQNRGANSILRPRDGGPDLFLYGLFGGAIPGQVVDGSSGAGRKVGLS